MISMNKRIFLLFLLTILSISGCSNVGYHGKFFDDIEQNIAEDFLNEHQVNTTFSKSDKPKKLFYCVDDDEKFATVFKNDYVMSIDYEKQFLIVCSFVSVYKRGHNLNKLYLNDDALIIRCSHLKCADGTGCACSPYQRWCAVLMDVVEYKTIDFTGE